MTPEEILKLSDKEILNLSEEELENYLRAKNLSFDKQQEDYFKNALIAIMLEKHKDKLCIRRSKSPSKHFDIISLNEAGKEVLKKIKKETSNDHFLPESHSDFKKIENLTLGDEKGQVIVIASQHKMGNTPFVANLAYNLALNYKEKFEVGESEKEVIFFSLKHSSDQLVRYIMSAKTHIPIEKVKSGDVSVEEFEALSKFNQTLESVPLFVLDQESLTFEKIKAQCLKRMDSSQNEIGAVVIEGFEKIDLSSYKYAEKEQRIGEVLRRLKITAKELKVPILVVLDLEKENMNIIDTLDVPTLADLDDVYQQYADVVMLVHCEYPTYFLKKPKREENETEAEYKIKLAEHEVEKQKCKNILDVYIAKNIYGKEEMIELDLG